MGEFCHLSLLRNDLVGVFSWVYSWVLLTDREQLYVVVACGLLMRMFSDLISISVLSVLIGLKETKDAAALFLSRTAFFLSYRCSTKVFVDMDNFLTVIKHLTSINQRKHENISTPSGDKICLFQAVQVTLCVDARLQMMWLDSVCVYLELISLIRYMVASSCLDGADRTFVSTSRF